MASFILKTHSNLSESEKNKLGTVGTKVNQDGAHLVSIISAYEGEYDNQPNFNITFEDGAGKTVEWTGYLTSKVGKDDKGAVKAGEYSVNGVKTQLNNEGDIYDNLNTIGYIKNLWKAAGLDADKFGDGIADGPVTAFGKTITAPIWHGLIGQSVTIVTSFELSLDKDKKRVWKNQKVSMANIFNSAGLSLLEVTNGKTEPVAIHEAVKTAKLPKAQFADIGYGIKFSDQKNPLCLQELKLLGMSGTKPSVDTSPAAGNDVDDTEEPF